MGRIGVVTDSTADLPAGLADELGLGVVPLVVTFGAESFVSRVTITERTFYDRLAASDELPTTSQPAPPWFEEAYAAAAADSLDAVVSIHLSAALSGTAAVARRVAATAPLPVTVVDSRQVSGGLALIALAAQRRAAAGGSLEEVVAAAEAVRARVRTLVVVDTLEYLAKGGRLSSTRALVGGVLRMKPLLEVADGEVVLREKARTWSRALDRLADVVVDHAGGAPADLVVAHAFAPDRAAALHDRLADRLDVRESIDTIVGPVVGTHTGPGAVGIAVARR